MVMRSWQLMALRRHQPSQKNHSIFLLLFFVALFLSGHFFQSTVSFAPPAVAQSDGAVDANDETIHVVRPGDTLFAIARRYAVNIGALMERNGLTDADFIYVGQRLVIPVAVDASPTPTMMPQSHSESTPTATLLPAPTATATTPIQVLTTVYTVQVGDTLSAIAKRFETTVSDLLRRNGMANADYVYVGQRLEVPVPMRDQPAANAPGTETNPIRINFATDATTASVEGILTFPERRCYALDAAAGQEMTVTINSGGGLANFFVRAANHAVNGGVPLKRLENADRTWRYTLPVSGDYLICVAVAEGAAAYSLSVSIPVSCTSVTQEIEVVDWATVVANEPALSHEVIGADDYVTVTGSTAAISGIPQFDQIVYGDFDGDCLEEAGIPLFSGGTAGNVGFLVFDMKDKATIGAAPALVAWGEGYKLLLLADSGVLVVSNALYNGWEPNCCPSGVSYDGYRLRDGELIRISSGSEGIVEMRVETVKHFYTLLQNGNFAEAYALLSPEFQAANPFTAWAAGYATTLSFTATVTENSEDTNRVAVTLEVTERLSNGTTRIRHYDGHWNLVWNGAAPGWILQDGAFVIVP